MDKSTCPIYGGYPHSYVCFLYVTLFYMHLYALHHHLMYYVLQLSFVDRLPHVRFALLVWEGKDGPSHLAREEISVHHPRSIRDLLSHLLYLSVKSIQHPIFLLPPALLHLPQPRLRLVLPLQQQALLVSLPQLQWLRQATILVRRLHQ